MSEIDLGGVPTGAVGLVVAARIDEQRGAARERVAHVFWRGGHRPVRREHGPDAGHLEHEVVRELEELAVRAEVVRERLREDERVGDQGAARVVADEQHRPAWRDVLQPAHIGAEPDVRHDAQRGQRARDVLGVTQLERVRGRLPAREMARVGGMGDIGRYGAEHPRVRGDGVQHPAHPAATAIAHDDRKRATLPVTVHGLLHRTPPWSPPTIRPRPTPRIVTKYGVRISTGGRARHAGGTRNRSPA